MVAFINVRDMQRISFFKVICSSGKSTKTIFCHVSFIPEKQPNKQAWVVLG